MLKEPHSNVQRAACDSPAVILFNTNPFFQKAFSQIKIVSKKSDCMGKLGF